MTRALPHIAMHENAFSAASPSSHAPALRLMICSSFEDGAPMLVERLASAAVQPNDDRSALERDFTDRSQIGVRGKLGQPATTEVAYRGFSTLNRRFILAETARPDSRTGDMAAAAATADLAVMLIDAREGLGQQTRRHSRIASLLGVRKVVVAVDKMDLLHWDQAGFDTIEREYRASAADLAFDELHFIPVSTLHGDNVVERSTRAAWYGGPSILQFLEGVEIGPGNVVCAASDPVEASDQFEAHLLWLSPRRLVPGRTYAAKIHTDCVTASVTQLKYRLDIDSGIHLAATTLGADDVGVVTLSFDRPVPFEPYELNRVHGSFILIDRSTHEIVGAGMILFALRRATNIHWQAIDVDAAARAEAKRQHPRCVWFTGLSGSGKSTIANLLDKRMHAAGKHTFVLDGDNVRHGLNRDLGFTEADRVENIRRIAEVARLMVDAGLIVLVAFISPFRSEREYARSLFKDGDFVEVFVDTPLGVCETRDTKGLYAKARAGRLPNFTGIDSPYEEPERPELRVSTIGRSAVETAERIAATLLRD